ncbi:hypothetical protein PT974_01902 [Cladobotryum mycophilum]|uniref:Peptidase S8/S53 domain-containing protein n=1 Tax=Cladobotryum mycophilum TaxID=491253 RepID=A0ABR0SWK1_9HYPO
MDQFVSRRLQRWARTTNKKRTFLHYLAQPATTAAGDLKRPMKGAIKGLAHLMETPDGRDRTPLVIALEEGNETFISAVSRIVKDDSMAHLRTAFFVDSDNRGNNSDTTCLHAALTCQFRKESQREKLIKTICSFLPETIFTLVDKRGRTPLHLAVEYDMCCSSQVGIVDELLRWGPKALKNSTPGREKENLSVYQYFESTRKYAAQNQPPILRRQNSSALLEALPWQRDEGSGLGMFPGRKGTLKRTAPAVDNGSTTPLTQKQNAKQEAAETIAEMLQLSPNSFQISNKEFWFDFSPPTKIGERDFHQLFSHLQFNPIPQYAAFPLIKRDKNDDVPDVLHQGRTKVEVLDWRRLDLDPVTLTRIGAHLRQVHLQWSRRNSVLRAWSEKEGLATIPTLEEIYLTQVELTTPEVYPHKQGPESKSRLHDNIESFEARLEASWPKGGPKPNAQTPAEETRSSPRHDPFVYTDRWMQCMDRFVSHFRQIEALRDKSPSPGPVKVALIDDGTDITHSDLAGIKFFGKSFHHYIEGSAKRVSPYWSSSSGHGTLMARLMKRICPSAIIHVIKLHTFVGSGTNKLQITPEKQYVHIISMSWTIKPPENPDENKAFSDAINAATNTKILMFYATSDQGHFADQNYPQSANRDTFRIGAAKATGGIFDAVCDRNKLSFIFPGDEFIINRSAPMGSRLNDLEGHSSSSIATALAAGLAALIIECVRLGVIYSNQTAQTDSNVEITDTDLNSIRERARMKGALLSIGTGHSTDHKYIEVWNTFAKVTEMLKREEGKPLEQL